MYENSSLRSKLRSEPVGIGKYSGQLAPWLVGRGNNVRVITAPPYFPRWSISKGYRNLFSTVRSHGLSIQRCPLWVPRRPSGLTRLLHLASFAASSLAPLLAQLVWKPDVVITVAPAFFCAPGALLLSRLCGRRTVTWLHIQDFELDAAFELGMLKGRWLRRIAEALECHILRGFTRVSSISTAMVQRLELKGVESSRSFLFPNWVDLESIRPQDDASRLQNPYRLELGISPDQIVLMYSGSMNKKQGLDLLVEVIFLLADLPQVVWLLAGEGPTKTELVRATEGFSQVIHLPLQPAECINDWLNASDIHLLPQKAGAADLVLPRSLTLATRACCCFVNPWKRPYIASKVGACTEPGNAKAFADALRCLISDPQQRLYCGLRARKLANERFSKDAVLTNFENQLLDLVEHQARF